MYAFSGVIRIKNSKDAIYAVYKDGNMDVRKVDGELVPYDANDMYLLRGEDKDQLFLPMSFGKIKGISLEHRYKEREDEYITRLYNYAKSLPEKALPVFWKSGETIDTEGLAIPAFETKYGQFYTFVSGTVYNEKLKDSEGPVIMLNRKTGLLELKNDNDVILSIESRYKGGDPYFYPLAVDDLMATAALYIAQSKIDKDKMFGIVKEYGRTYLAEIGVNSSVDIREIAECSNLVNKVSVPRQPFIKVVYNNDFTASLSSAYLGPHGQMICMGGSRVPVKDVKESILYQSVEMLWHIDWVKEKIGDNPNLQIFGPSTPCKEFMNKAEPHWANLKFLDVTEECRQTNIERG